VFGTYGEVTGTATAIVQNTPSGPSMKLVLALSWTMV